jgi:hypothetical protein
MNSSLGERGLVPVRHCFPFTNLGLACQSSQEWSAGLIVKRNHSVQPENSGDTPQVSPVTFAGQISLSPTDGSAFYGRRTQAKMNPARPFRLTGFTTRIRGPAGRTPDADPDRP